MQKIYKNAKKYPEISENFILLTALRAVSQKKALKKPMCQALIKDYTLALQQPARMAPEEYLDHYFKKTPPSDKLIHLSKDCLLAGLLKSIPYDERVRADASSIFKSIEQCDFDALYERHSAVHSILYNRNCLHYRITDNAGRRYIRKLVYDYAKHHRISDKNAAGLFTEEQLRFKHQRIKYIYGASFILLTLSLWSFLMIYCGILPFFLLAVPVFMLAYEILLTILSFTLDAEPILKIRKNTESAPVLTVVASILSKKKDIDLLCEKLYKMRRMNARGDFTFGLLLDFPESSQDELEGEKELIDYAIKKVRALNEKEHCFALFIRKRSFLPKEKKYLGWERKRGALIQLARAIRLKEEDGFSAFECDRKRLEQNKYILTLDSDTELRYGAVDTLMRAMLHPFNMPIIKNGVVVRGYGILQPRMVTGVESSGKSPFSLLFAGSGGVDSYQNTVFDFYQSVFSKTAFCGKGIFDIDIFLETVDGHFPENRILSHDILEGTRMRCGALTELALTDSTPATALSYYKRQHRWLRGDFQNLPFLLPRLLNGERNPIDRASKFMLGMNIVRSVTPIFSLASLFLSTALTESRCAVFLFFSFSYLLFPLMCTVLRSAKYIGRQFYSSAMQNIWQSICQTLFTLSSLAHSAYLAADALLKSFYRSMISEKKLLEWVTADQSEQNTNKKSGIMLLGIYLKKSVFSVFVGALMLFGSEGGLVRLFGLSFLFFPFISFWLSRPFKHPELILKDKRAILRYAKDSLRYFETFVTEKDRYLPPDNFQEIPDEIIAHRTSPTNIGLYLSSLVVGYDLKLIDEVSLLHRLSLTVDSVLSLPKYKGHLYNWYSTETGEILGTPYISAVDSGNFVVSLIAVREAISGLENSDNLLKKLNALIDHTDFSFLYDDKKKLLAIGYDPIKEERSENCYDLYASEARSGYIFAIAKGQIPIESWGKLFRPITVKDGYMGILSWSGTAFEYFMPSLFFPIYRNTLQYELLCFAMSIQMKERYEGQVWGKSESCYFHFDEAMNYQYRAFGSPVLALDKEAGRHDVIAPYASFLMLALDHRYPLENLKQIEKVGGYGYYGFYDAIDFTPARVGKGYAVIRSYMCHHIGMSLIAADNALLNGIFQKRVMADPDISALKELLTERIPVDAPKAEIILRESKSTLRFDLPQSGEFAQHREWTACAFAVLDAGKLSIIASSTGYLGLRSKEQLITPPYSSNSALKIVYLDQQGEEHPLLKDCRLFAKQDALRIESAYGNILLQKEHDCISLKIKIKKHEGKGVIRLQTSILLCNASEYLTHPAFQALLVEGLYENDLIFFRKRSRSSSQSDGCFAVSSNEKILRARLSADQALTSAPPKRTFCRLPELELEAALSSTGESTLRCAYAKEPNESKDLIARSNAQEKRPEKQSKEQRFLIEYTSLLLKCALLKGKPKDFFCDHPIEELWQFGISGDHPILIFEFSESKPDERLLRIVSRLVRAQHRLYCVGIRSDLVFLTKESDHYFHPLENALLNTVTAGCGRAIFKKAGGVHIVNAGASEKILSSFARIRVVVDEDSIFESISKQIDGCLKAEQPLQNAYHRAVRSFQIDEESVILRGRSENDVPWSYIYCNRQFGILLTDKSLGFSWFRNAGELRLTPFSGKEKEEPTGELLILHVGKNRFDLIAHAFEVQFFEKYAKYCGQLGKLHYSVLVTVDEKLPVKIVTLQIENKGEVIEAEVEYRITPCLFRIDDGNIGIKKLEDTLFFKRTADYTGNHIGGYLTASRKHMVIKPKEPSECFFLLGAYNLQNDRCYYHVRSRYNDIKAAKEAMKQSISPSVFRLESACPEIDLFFNKYLIEQIKKSRLYGRTGYSQPGGAYGFRDQLQDALNLLEVDEEILKLQLFRAAAHQFTKGDVQHWWHPLDYTVKKGDPGIRTACSDDYLFLVYATAVYLQKTGDEGILSFRIGYLDGIPLKQGEERYERPERSVRTESLYHHCIRALDLALERRDSSGLCLIGSCDWNDGFSAIRGSSVWLTQFLYLTLSSFLPYCHAEEKASYQKELPKLKQALEKQFHHDRYLRAYFENGQPLGEKNGSYCKIDLLSQAFSVFIEKNERSERAMATAYNALFDEKLLLFRLFAPSFDLEGKFPGYLGGYCPGFRENGGQYTHAAMWGAKALFLLDENEKAMKVLLGSNPLYRQKHWGERYALEPYALAGDIYYAIGEEGRGGWSQYTGAAGWYYSVLLEDLLGYKQSGDHFSLEPHLSPSFPYFVLTIVKNGTEYRIEVSLSENAALLLDGKPCKNQFFFDKQRHNVKLVLAKSKKM